jgi:hypothetical protein
MVTIRGYDKNDTMPFSGCASNGATGTNAFIIGMCMKANKC